MDLAAVVERIDRRLEALGLTAAKASKDAGLSADAIRNMKRALKTKSHTGASATTLTALAPVLQTTVAWLVDGEGEDQSDSRPRTKGQPIHYVPGEDVVLPGRTTLLPVYAGAMGGSGKLILSTEIVDRVAMPAALAGVTGAYGILFDGESMIPEYWPGDIGWINPHLKPMRGKNHVFYHTPPGGEEAEAIVKRLNGWNDRDWDLQQWNPAKEFKESRKIWPICHRVVGKYDAV